MHGLLRFYNHHCQSRSNIVQLSYARSYDLLELGDGISLDFNNNVMNAIDSVSLLYTSYLSQISEQVCQCALFRIYKDIAIDTAFPPRLLTLFLSFFPELRWKLNALSLFSLHLLFSY